MRPSLARQNLAPKRRHRLVDFDQIIAENAADPSIAHVEPNSLARRGGRQVVEVDAAHIGAVAASGARPSRCFLFSQGSRAKRSAPIVFARVSTHPSPFLRRIKCGCLKSH